MWFADYNNDYQMYGKLTQHTRQTKPRQMNHKYLETREEKNMTKPMIGGPAWY